MVDFVKHQLPGTFGGYNVHGMTLKQSEAYAMADGTSFDKECYTLWKGKFTNDENKDEHKYDNVKMAYGGDIPTVSLASMLP